MWNLKRTAESQMVADVGMGSSRPPTRRCGPVGTLANPCSLRLWTEQTLQSLAGQPMWWPSLETAVQTLWPRLPGPERRMDVNRVAPFTALLANARHTGPLRNNTLIQSSCPVNSQEIFQEASMTFMQEILQALPEATYKGGTQKPERGYAQRRGRHSALRNIVQF